MVVSNPFRQIRLQPLDRLEECRACPRLVAWREAQAGPVPPRFRAWVGHFGFWARPVPAFGDPAARIAIVGLAPAAQGANRTGRMFTGDRSGDFLYGTLYRAGMASSPTSVSRDDGMVLSGVLITAPVRCAPPDNRPTAEEQANCRAFLAADLANLDKLRVLLALGRFAHNAVLGLSGLVGLRARPAHFSHGAEHELADGLWLVDSYHPSQQNTFTGRLTAAMFDRIVLRCRELAGEVVTDGQGRR